MASGSKQGSSSLKNWGRRNQITIINASFTVFLVGSIVAMLLVTATNLQRRTTEESVINLAGLTASEIQSNFLAYFNTVKNISEIMSNYETIDVRQRRTFFNDTMQGILNSNSSMVSVYSLWQPNALDGLDALYANTEGSSPTGQYINGFTRERGWVEQRLFNEYRHLLVVNFAAVNGLNGIVSEPVFKWSEVLVVDIQFPILKGDAASPEVIGVVGATINLEQLQGLIETIRPYETGMTLLCTNRGAIVAHSNHQLRGEIMPISYDIDPLFVGEDPYMTFFAILNSIEDQDYKVVNTRDTMIVSYPLKTVGPFTSARYGSPRGNPAWAVVTAVPMETIFAPLNAMLRFSIFFIVGAGILAAVVVFLTSSSITQHTLNLQRSLEHSTTMQDNLKYGLFLMDQKYIIQGAHSKALEHIMAVSNLEGKNFIDLISNSVKSSELGSIKDYLEMVFKKTFDDDMLESINPINDFTYVSTETSEVKSLRTSFTLAERGRGASYILATVEDITAEKELKRQLLEAESLRENEMRSLFQVIQLDPRVLRDFIDDAEFEFEKINNTLKDKNSLQQDVLVGMYQSIHAIKSNALILNLESLSQRLHKLESSIKKLQQEYKSAVPFEGFLGLVLELNEAMNEIDKLKGNVSKIESFRMVSSGDKDQEAYVLIETLTRACSKTQSALGKKVRFVAEDIDEGILEYAPRRIIKEVLTQLVRNAVYHGIETPAERKARGKETEGEIRLSIKHMDGQIIINLSDNGKGIDFNRIRKTALDSNLLRNPEQANDTRYLLKVLFSPGFSTIGKADFHAGRGIGLNLVKDRVKDLNGKISVATEPGKGTTFTISIPLDLSDVKNAS